MAAIDGRDPVDDYNAINYELEAYGDTLAFKHKLIVANKMDLSDAEAHLNRFKKEIKEEILPISALAQEGLDELIGRIEEVLCRENSQEK